MFVNSPAFDTQMPPFDWDRKVVAAYAEDDVLMSGWLLGENMIARKTAVRQSESISPCRRRITWVGVKLADHDLSISVRA